MLIIRLYSGPVFVGDEEEQENSTPIEAEDAIVVETFAA